MFNIPVAEAGATVYIRVDGSIDPSWANITSADNVTYTLIGNVNDSVVVQRANIVLDGAGYAVQGGGSGIGVNVTGVSNVTIKNCLIKNFRVGIYLDVGANNGRVENNTIQDLYGAQNEDAVGTHLKSNYNTIFNNTMSNLKGWNSSLTSGLGGTVAGVYLSSSNGNNLTANTITNSAGGTGGAGPYKGSGGSGGTVAGVYLSSSNDNNLISNTVTSLTGGTGGTGYGGAGGPGGVSAGVWLDTSSYDNRITALVTQGSYEEPDPSKWNTIEGKPILYFYNETSLNVSNFNVTTRTAPILIGGSTATGNPGGSGGISTGLALINITNSIVQNNTISGFKGVPGGTGGYYGLGGSGGASAGIYLFSSTGNNLTSNAVANVTGGTGGAVGQYGGSSGAKGTSYSLYLYQSNSMTIKENTLQAADYCLYLYSSSNNTVYYNNFITNQSRVSNQNSNNTWDNGYPSGGNYWSNYTGVDTRSGPNQVETESDGISDTPYDIDENNQDRYPLMGPFNIFDAGTWNGTAYNVDVVSNSTVSEFQFNPSEGALLRFNVTGEDGTSGFCRVTVPKDLLWAEHGWTVYVGEESVNYTIIPDNGYTYLYFTYNHSTKTVLIQGTHVIPEFPSALIMPLLMTLTMLAVVLAKKRFPRKPES